MMRRRRVGRAVVRTAAVGGVAYAAGSHGAKKSAAEAQQEAQQNAQIADLQQQQAAAAPPMDQQPAPPPPQAAAPTPSGMTTEKIEQLKQLGQLRESGILTDAEFESEKQKILGS